MLWSLQGAVCALAYTGGNGYATAAAAEMGGVAEIPDSGIHRRSGATFISFYSLMSCRSHPTLQSETLPLWVGKTSPTVFTEGFRLQLYRTFSTLIVGSAATMSGAPDPTIKGEFHGYIHDNE